MDKLQTTLIILTCALIIAMGYILIEKINLCETAKNESYALGVNDGINFWNSIVIRTVNENKELPYILNKTVQSIPIGQLGER